MSAKPLRILAMDGGGSLSLLSLFMLERIQQERPDFLSNIDLFSGTSSGGINSLLIAGSEPRHVGLHQAIYLWRDGQVFSGPMLNKVRALGGCSAFFTNTALADYLRTILGKRTLGDIKAGLVIPAFDVNGQLLGQETWKPKIFHNFGGNEEPDTELEAVEVALRTSAAPVFFPIYNRFADGGLAANNPTMCALAQALATPPKGCGRTPADIQLLSVGTGWDQSFLGVDNANWGYQQWLLSPCKPLALVQAFFEGTSMVATFQARTLLERQFFRLNPLINKSFNINDMFQDAGDPGFDDKVKLLKEVAEKPDLNMPVMAGDPEPRGEGEGSEELWLQAVLFWLDAMGWTEPPGGGRKQGGSPPPSGKPPLAQLPVAQPAAASAAKAAPAAKPRRRAKKAPAGGGSD